MNERDRYVDSIRCLAEMVNQNSEMPSIHKEEFKFAVCSLMKLEKNIYKNANGLIDLICEFIRRDEEDEIRDDIAKKIAEEIEKYALTHFKQEVIDDVWRNYNIKYYHDSYPSNDCIPHSG